MGIKEDYKQAQALAKQGQFIEARKLLIAHDHEKTNALLEKVNSALATSGKIASDVKQVNPVLRFVSALMVFIVATGVTGGLGTMLFSAYSEGFTNEGIIYGALFGLWVLLMFIGFRVSRAILQR